MNFKGATVAFISISIVAIAAVSLSRLGRKRLAQSEPPRPTLTWRAEQASRQGIEHVYFDAPSNSYAQPRTLQEALEYYDVIVAEPMKKESFAEDNHEFIKTWYQFKVLEYLHHRSISDCPTCPPTLTPPSEVLAADTNQILVPRDGGDLIIKGISLSSGEPDFNAFEMNRKYVLFLVIDPTKRIGTVLAGPSGIYTLDSNGLLQPFSSKSNPLGEEIHKRFNNSFAALKGYLRNKRS